MKRIFTFLVSIIMITEIALGYTTTIKVGAFEGSITSQEGNVVTIIPKVGIEVWEVKKGGITVTENQYIMPGTDVEIEGRISGKYPLTIDFVTYTRIEEKTAGIEVTVQADTVGGYNFTGWTYEGITLTEAQRTSQTITFTMPSNAVNLIANYAPTGSTPEGTTYTVSYSANGGSGAPASQIKTRGTPLTLSSIEPIRDGYEFLGWSTNNTSEVPEYQAGGSFNLDSNTTLYAVWLRINGINVTYNANGGEFDDGTVNVLYYEESESPIKISKTPNINDQGVATTNYGRNETFREAVTIPGATLLAVTITYQTQSTTSESLAIYDETALPDNYPDYEDSISGPLGGTTKLTTTFTVEGDTVQFYFSSSSYTSGGYGYYAQVRSIEELMLTSGDYKEPSRPGYSFLGWSKNNNATTPTYIAGESFMPEESMTLYAVWEKVNEPLLVESEMVPVKWDDTLNNWVTTTEEDWGYNYNTASRWIKSAGNTSYGVGGNGTAKWANVMLRDGLSYYNSGSSGTTTTVASGDTVPAGKVIATQGSSYVWIPRFTYRTEEGDSVSWNGDGAGTARTYILFSNGTADYTSDPNDSTIQYNKHSAFSPGGTEITGFWVAKYESSEGENEIPKSLPDQKTWTYEIANNMYNFAKDLNGTNYNIGAHLIKGSEWGAVAYLTSAIGRIPYANNYYVSYNTLKTGYSGAEEESESVEEDEELISYLWNTEEGVRASTTHNVYGVYDMSGGADEVVAEYNTSASSDKCTTLLESYTNNGTLYVDGFADYPGTGGDRAMLGWDDDDSDPSSYNRNRPLSTRGGRYYYRYERGLMYNNHGIFNYSSDCDGVAEYLEGFRVTLFGFSL